MRWQHRCAQPAPISLGSWGCFLSLDQPAVDRDRHAVNKICQRRTEIRDKSTEVGWAPQPSRWGEGRPGREQFAHRRSAPARFALSGFTKEGSIKIARSERIHSNAHLTILTRKGLGEQVNPGSERTGDDVAFVCLARKGGCQKYDPTKAALHHRGEH